MEDTRDIMKTQDEPKMLTRASFLKLGALGLGAVAASSLLGCNDDTPDGSEGTYNPGVTSNVAPLPEWDHECDILFCGVGTSSGGAAIEAIDRGDDVLMIEKNSWLGGIMRQNGGGIAGAGTKIQEYLGVEDDPDLCYEYLAKCGEDEDGVQRLDLDKLRIIADESGALVDWVLLELGGQKVEDWDFCTPEDRGMTRCGRPGLNVSGLPTGYEKYGIEPRIQRCHWTWPDPEDTATDRGYAEGRFMGNELDEGRGGTGLWAIFEKNLVARDARILTETELVSLVTRDTADGPEVVGIVARDATGDVYIKAKKAVIITTGGWVNNEYLMQTYTLKPAINRINPDGSMQNDGAGVIAAMALGAATTNMAKGGSFASMSGGIVTDVDGRVIDVYGNPIPRLYASSYAVGGKYFEVYAQCGFHVTWNMIFGLRAAKHANTLTAWE